MSLWGKQDQADNKPKYITSETELATVFGVDVAEAQLEENRAQGIKTPGWTKFVTYTDAQGNVRTKAETLVAMGAGQTVEVMSDAEDAVVVDRTITISAQPTTAQVPEGETVGFSVVAAVAPTTTLTYQWQKQEGGTGAWSNIVDATSALYTTPALTVADDNGDKYRVVVSADGAKSKTSSVATLTVTEAV